MKFTNRSFNLRGTEETFQAMVDKAITERPTVAFNYLEIGIAKGGTLATVADYLRSKCSEWSVTGIDLCDSPFFDPKDFLRHTLSHNTVINFQGKDAPVVVLYPESNDIDVHLLKSCDKRPEYYGEINFALIDGCHGAPCVEKDFLSIECNIAPDGIVAFHDAGFKDQGIHPQAHCRTPISVIEAFGNMMMPGPFGPARERTGWRLLAHIEGDKSPGNPEENGHGFAFFQKHAV